LLPAGITGVFGDFESGDVVDLLAPDGRIVARGFVGHDAAELPGIVGRSLPELPADLRHPVVHADDLIAVPSVSGAAPGSGSGSGSGSGPGSGSGSDSARPDASVTSHSIKGA